MATRKQTQAARTNVKKAAKAAASKKSIATMPKKVKTALGKQGAAVAQRKKTGSSSPKTRQELYEEAKRRNIGVARRWDATSSPRRSAAGRRFRFRSRTCQL